MTREEIIAQLQDLIRDREAFLEKDEPDNVFQKDIIALRYAVDHLTGSATGGRENRCPTT